MSGRQFILELRKSTKSSDLEFVARAPFEDGQIDRLAHVHLFGSTPQCPPRVRHAFSAAGVHAFHLDELGAADEATLIKWLGALVLGDGNTAILFVSPQLVDGDRGIAWLRFRW